MTKEGYPNILYIYVNSAQFLIKKFVKSCAFILKKGVDIDKLELIMGKVCPELVLSSTIILRSTILLGESPERRTKWENN